MLRLFRRHRWVLPLVGLAVAGLFLARRHFLPGRDGASAEADGPRIPPDSAARFVGRSATVCGRVSEASFARGVEGRPTFLNFGGRHPDQAFTAVIWGRYRGAFRAPPERAYRGARACVSGRIRRHRGTPQIEVRSPAQIQVTGRPEPSRSPRSRQRDGPGDGRR